MLEKKIEKYLVDQVKAMGGIAYKFVSPGNDGVPDRIVVLPGQVVFVELKTEVGRLSEVQKVQCDRLSKLGQKVVVLRGLDQVKQFVTWARAEVEHSRAAAVMLRGAVAEMENGQG